MTPKEKANELLGKMKLQMQGPGIEAGEGNAKRCALIAVEEIREQLKNQYNNTWSEHHREIWGYWCNGKEAEFWQQVKQEIEKL